MFACHTATDLFLWNSMEVLLLTSVLAGPFLSQAKLLVLPSTCPLLPLLDPTIFFCSYPWKPGLKGIEIALASILKKKERKKEGAHPGAVGDLDSLVRGWDCDPGEETGTEIGGWNWETHWVWWLGETSTIWAKWGRPEERYWKNIIQQGCRGRHRPERRGHWDRFGKKISMKNHEARWKKGCEEVLREWQGNQVWLGI